MKKKNRSEELAQIEERLEDEVAACKDALADAQEELDDFLTDHNKPWKNDEEEELYWDLCEIVEFAESSLADAEEELQDFYADPEAYLDEEEDDGLRISDFI